MANKRSAAVIELSWTGEADVAVAPELKKAAREAWRALRTESPGEVGELVLDLSGVSFIDTVALGVLVTIRRKCKRDGNLLVLCAPSAPVRKLLEATGLDDRFTVRDR